MLILLNECICLNVKFADCDVYMLKKNYVFFYLNLYMYISISYVGYSITLYLDCTLAWYRYIGRKILVAVILGGQRGVFLVIFFCCLESFILFWVKLWFCNTRDLDLFSIIILCFEIHYLNSAYFIKTMW